MSRDWPGVNRRDWASPDVRRREDTDYDVGAAVTAKRLAQVETAALTIPPTDADYVVLTANSGLSAERVLTAGNGISLDTSVAGAVTVATPEFWVTKAAVTDRASTTTYAADPDLTFAAATGTYYVLGRLLAASASATPDIKVQLTFPSSSSVLGSYWSDAGTNTVIAQDSSSPAMGVTFAIAANGITLVQFEVMLVAGAAGTFAVEWAQASSSSTATTVSAGSFLRYRKTA